MAPVSTGFAFSAATSSGRAAAVVPPRAYNAAAIQMKADMTHGRRARYGLAWLDDLRRDTYYALRTLTRAPAFTIVAMLTLALGIGAVTVIYSVVYNVAIAPLPYRDADRLV